MPLKNVEKIEIVRGPGSALYGANAFLAVINIITKRGHDIDGLEVSTGFGSFDTQEYNLMYGGDISGVEVTGFVDYYNTNGLSETIKKDIFSDVPFYNRFSLAPGDTDDSRNKLDLYLKTSYKNLELNAKYMNKDSEPFVSHNYVLTNDSDQHLNYVFVDLKYKWDISDKFAFKPKAYYDQHEQDSAFEFLPDGFIMPFDLDEDGDIESFPEGQFAESFVIDRKAGAEAQFDYEIFKGNVLTLGAVYEWQKQENVRIKASFNPQTGAAFDTVQDVSDMGVVPEATRQRWALYLQDKWDITHNLGLTVGVRHDHYSDFEGTTNPRIGFVWEFIDNATLKALYGQAFRAPNFAELFTNNTTLKGDAGLKPETIRTYEIGLGYKVTDSVSTNVNYFFNVIRDLIGISPLSAPGETQLIKNLGGANVQGVEFETRADLSRYWRGAYAFANYTYQDAESKGDPLPDVPKHKGNVGLNAGITKYLNANLHAFISGSRIREEADTRDDSPGYALLNLTLLEILSAYPLYQIQGRHNFLTILAGRMSRALSLRSNPTCPIFGPAHTLMPTTHIRTPNQRAIHCLTFQNTKAMWALTPALQNTLTRIFTHLSAAAGLGKRRTQGTTLLGMRCLI